MYNKEKHERGMAMGISYEHCTLCPRKCGVDRTAGQRGFCGMSDQMKIARTAAHYWEEPVISGSFGSGTVFFSGCTLGCAFCQNTEISHEHKGKEISSARLREIFEQLIDEGVQNINLVTPTHFLPSILPALIPRLPVPVVYNCGGYESVETLKRLEGLVDIYLPDMKYSNNLLAKKLSKAPDYVETASAAILEMYRQVGPVQIKDDIMQKGMILRHLILPGQIDNSLGVLDWVDEHFQPGQILFSLMSQYTPMPGLEDYPELQSTVTPALADFCYRYMIKKGIEDGYYQDPASATDEMIPAVDMTGV